MFFPFLFSLETRFTLLRFETSRFLFLKYLKKTENMSSNDFITQLTALTHPDTNAIRAAEANLKPMLKDPRCIEALMEVLDQQQQVGFSIEIYCNVVH